MKSAGATASSPAGRRIAARDNVTLGSGPPAGPPAAVVGLGAGIAIGAARRNTLKRNLLIAGPRPATIPRAGRRPERPGRRGRPDVPAAYLGQRRPVAGLGRPPVLAVR